MADEADRVITDLRAAVSRCALDGLSARAVWRAIAFIEEQRLDMAHLKTALMIEQDTRNVVEGFLAREIALRRART